MFRNRRKMPEVADKRRDSISGRGNGRNGPYHASEMLSWYFAQPAVKEPAYVLTADGYVIVATGFHRPQKGFDMEELMK